MDNQPKTPTGGQNTHTQRVPVEPDPIELSEEIEELEAKFNRTEKNFETRMQKASQRSFWIISLLIFILIITSFTAAFFYLKNQRDSEAKAKESSSSKTSQSYDSSSNSNSLNSSSSLSSSATSSPAAAAKTYTNQYYPTLKIIYDESWTFDTSTTNTSYPGIVSRKIKLSKGGVDLWFIFTPKFIFGCGPFETAGIISSQGLSLKSGALDRFKINAKPSTQYYLKKGTDSVFNPAGCPSNGMTLNSTLSSAEYTKNFPDEKNILAFIQVYVEGSNDNAILEADKIVDQSTLYDKIS